MVENMNQRFLELALQAGFIEDDGGDNLHVFDGYEAITCTEELKKFAELIIKECLGDHKERIATRYQGSDYDRAVAYGMEIVYYDIVEKFGVE